MDILASLLFAQFTFSSEGCMAPYQYLCSPVSSMHFICHVSDAPPHCHVFSLYDTGDAARRDAGALSVNVHAYRCRGNSRPDKAHLEAARGAAH